MINNKIIDKNFVFLILCCVAFVIANTFVIASVAKQSILFLDCFVPRNDGVRLPRNDVSGFPRNDGVQCHVSTFNPVRDCRSVENVTTRKTGIP